MESQHDEAHTLATEGILDDGTTKPLLYHSGIRGESENDRECQAFLSGDKTAQLLAKSGRKHRDCTLHEIDARGAFAGIAIESRVGLDEIGDIRNVHADIEAAIFVLRDGQSVINIPGSRGINRENSRITQVLASFILALGDAATLHKPKSGKQTNELTSKEEEGGI